jgi:hypothetical protein
MLELGIFQTWLTNSQIGSGLRVRPSIQINLGEEGNKVACDFTASIALVYRLSTSKLTLSDLNKDLPGLESLLKHKRRLRKLWQVTWDRAYKMAVNWVARAIRQMSCRKALERWETKVENC